MTLRLAGAVLPPADREIHLPGPAFPGAPVVVGQRGADATEALAALERLVRAGGPYAAGAGLDLGGGFASARLDGGRGDRRDAYLAALQAAPHGLGPPAEILAALFGPAATKRVGAAALRAIDAGEWAVVRFAAAASDVVGPEQLERILALRAAGGLNPYGEGQASDTAAHLARLLDPVPRPRRTALLTDLWTRVASVCAAADRGELLRAWQDSGRREELRERYEKFDDTIVLRHTRTDLGTQPRPAQLARWVPSPDFVARRARYLFADALAVTVLGRAAETAFDAGVPAAMERHRHEMTAVGEMLSNDDWADLSVPATGDRPAVVLKDLLQRPESGRTAFVLARDWGMAVREVVEEFLWESVGNGEGGAVQRAIDEWFASPMTSWRSAVGSFSPERADGWALTRDGYPSLAERGPDAVEQVGDMIWFAELGDQIARLYGRAGAEVDVDGWVPSLVVDADPLTTPLVPRTDSITAAVAGAAQLVELGGAVPAKVRSWPEVVDGLLAGAAVAEALTGAFELPEVIAAVDGTTVPGTDLTVEVARTGRQLAEWGHYMGNCIGGGYYLQAAEEQETVLLALRSAGSVVLNAELNHRHRHWFVAQLRARFNADPAPELEKLVRSWVRSLKAPSPAPVLSAGEPSPARAARRPTPAARILRAAGPSLTALLNEHPIAPPGLLDLAALLPRPPRTRGPEAVVALRRAAPATLDGVCRRALSDLDGLWKATGERPMARAIGRLPAELRLGPLAEDAPLPGYLRPLSHLPEVVAARAVDLAGLRLRAALGRLLRDDDPALVAALDRRPGEQVRCALALAKSVLPGADPIYPAAQLDREPWLSARAGATELLTDRLLSPNLLGN